MIRDRLIVWGFTLGTATAGVDPSQPPWEWFLKQAPMAGLVGFMTWMFLKHLRDAEKMRKGEQAEIHAQCHSAQQVTAATAREVSARLEANTAREIEVASTMATATEKLASVAQELDRSLDKLDIQE